MKQIVQHNILIILFICTVNSGTDFYNELFSIVLYVWPLYKNVDQIQSTSKSITTFCVNGNLKVVPLSSENQAKNGYLKRRHMKHLN